MKRFKILYLTFHPQIGGGETILLSLLSKLDLKLFKPIVVVTAAGQLTERLKKLGIETHVLALKGYLIRTLFIPGVSLLGIYLFLKFVRKIKADLIHLNHLNLGVYAGVAAKLLKIPVVATAHGPWDCFYFYQDFVNQIFADIILANTPKVAQDLTKRKIVNPKKIKLVSFGVDPNVFRPANKILAKQKFGLPKNHLVVTIVGRIDPEKDHLTFFQAAKEVLNQFPRVSFFVVGSTLGDFSNLKNGQVQAQINKFLNQNPNLAKKIVFAGFIKNMPEVFAATDILVSSSVRESFGLALAEASASGIPVVSTNIGGQSLIIQDGKTGFLVPPRQPSILAKKILQLAKNQKMRQKFGKAAMDYIIKNFNLEKYVQNVEKVYLSLLERAGKIS